VIMQSWRFVEPWLPALGNTFLLIVPATIVFAWIFFWVCERPYMRKSAPRKAEESPREINAIAELEPESA
jgi:peptidoglycan/LPS O-acetylase OafA/YrhL